MPDWTPLAFLFEDVGGPPFLEGGRVWTVLTESNAYWEPRYEVVIASWPFHSEDEDNQQQQNEDEPDVHKLGGHRQRIGKGLRDIKQWGRLVLVRILGYWLKHIECWLRGCGCHSFSMRADLWEDKCHCILEGKRVVDIAAGRLHRFLEDGARFHHQKLPVQLPRQISLEDRSYITRLYSIAKSQVIAYGHAAAQPFIKLPVRSLGMGCEDDVIALEIAVDCISQFDALTPEERSRAHPRTIEMFSRCSAFRA